jgi:hypothetical protein
MTLLNLFSLPFSSAINLIPFYSNLILSQT